MSAPRKRQLPPGASDKLWNAGIAASFGVGGVVVGVLSLAGVLLQGGAAVAGGVSFLLFGLFAMGLAWWTLRKVFPPRLKGVELRVSTAELARGDALRAEIRAATRA